MAFKSRQHRFSLAPQVSIQRSGFDRSFTHTTTFDAGYLIPFYVDEVLPGDTFKCNCSLFARMLTPVVPFMDNVYLDTHFFFVPYRLLWDHWVNMHGEQANPDDSIDYVVPKIKFMPKAENGMGFDFKADVGSIYDYMGVPTGKTGFSISALPLRAYNKIWNEWFRDENIQDSVLELTSDNDVTPGNYKLLRRGKRHDYFTSALPWPQKGPGVELPIGDYAPVKYDLAQPSQLTYAGHTYQSILSTGTFVDRQVRLATGGETYEQHLSVQGGTAMSPMPAHTMASLYADLSTATATTINELRQAFQIQRLLEASARGGTRYTELLQSIFGVTNPDARLQRSEYLGGGSTRLSVYQVPQTASTDESSPQGNLAAFATASDSRPDFTHSFTEHGTILGVMVARYDHTYQQGLPRQFSRKTRFDFYFPVFAHLGEQEIRNREIYLQSDSVVNADGDPINDEVFGYQERWAEYRYSPSMVTGEMRSAYATSLDSWHLADDYSALPTLSDAWIREDKSNVDRVLAVQSSVSNQLFADIFFNEKVTRPMPLYSIPGLIDHY